MCSQYCRPKQKSSNCNSLFAKLAGTAFWLCRVHGSYLQHHITIHSHTNFCGLHHILMNSLLPSIYGILAKCCCNVGPTSPTPAQHYNNIRPTYRVCWLPFTLPGLAITHYFMSYFDLSIVKSINYTILTLVCYIYPGY